MNELQPTRGRVFIDKADMLRLDGFDIIVVYQAGEKGTEANQSHGGYFII